MTSHHQQSVKAHGLLVSLMHVILLLDGIITCLDSNPGIQHQMLEVVQDLNRNVALECPHLEIPYFFDQYNNQNQMKHNSGKMIQGNKCIYGKKHLAMRSKFILELSSISSNFSG